MRALLKKIIPCFVFSGYHFFLAAVAALWYRFSSRKMIVIGVTGTTGKSTTVNLISRILEEAGYKVGLTSSLNFKIGQSSWLNPYHMTMVGRFLLQKTLRKMCKAGCRYAVIEVTSEGIKQFRHLGIDFDVAVFTNLAKEHIESHGGFDKYREAKGKLFASLRESFRKGVAKVIVANLDDKNVGYFLNFWADKKYGFCLRPKFPLFYSFTPILERITRASNIKLESRGSTFFIDKTRFNLKLLGEFNVYNALAAITVGLSQGVCLDLARRALARVREMPGRMELIETGQNFKVIVDLAHTPEAFEKIFKTARTSFGRENSRIICVFGSAGGGRDKRKRPLLAKVAAKHCDYIFITNEDPYEEKPEVILNDIEKGFIKVGFKNYEKIEDRREAIRVALKKASRRDIVLLLGKGTEAFMVIGNKKIPWDEREVAREELKKLSRKE